MRFKKEQMPKTTTEALQTIRVLHGEMAYPDIDATTDEGAKILLARWFIFEASIQRIENELAKLRKGGKP